MLPSCRGQSWRPGRPRPHSERASRQARRISMGCQIAPTASLCATVPVSALICPSRCVSVLCSTRGQRVTSLSSHPVGAVLTNVLHTCWQSVCHTSCLKLRVSQPLLHDNTLQVPKLPGTVYKPGVPRSIGHICVTNQPDDLCAMPIYRSPGTPAIPWWLPVTPCTNSTSHARGSSVQPWGHEGICQDELMCSFSCGWRLYSQGAALIESLSADW